MNPKFINNTNLKNNSENTKETESQQCMSDSVTKSYNSFFGEEHLPEGHITTHPFSLTLEELSGLLKNGPEFSQNSQTPEPPPDKKNRGCVENSTQLFQDKSINSSEWPESPDSISQSTEPSSNKKNRGCVENSTQLFQDKSIDSSEWPESPDSISQSTEPSSNKKNRGCVENSTQLFESKPIGGSGWLNKSTKLKSTQRGPVEYPRVKDNKRDPNNCSHWYWYYRWQKKGKNGKPLYKKNGSPVTECIYCPQKKVGAVEQAIAAKLPHRQILEIIKGDNSTRPPT